MSAPTASAEMRMPTPAQSPVEQGLSAVDDSLARLGERIDRLRDALHPVSTPAHPEPPAPSGVGVPTDAPGLFGGSAVAERLAETLRTVERFDRWVDSMYDRLEV